MRLLKFLIIRFRRIIFNITLELLNMPAATIFTVIAKTTGVKPALQYTDQSELAEGVLSMT